VVIDLLCVSEDFFSQFGGYLRRIVIGIGNRGMRDPKVGGNRLERSLASADFANLLSPSLSRAHHRENAGVTLSLILDRGNT
jgi:hypothetical protein